MTIIRNVNKTVPDSRTKRTPGRRSKGEDEMLLQGLIEARDKAGGTSSVPPVTK
jgi:hypothetical protein